MINHVLLGSNDLDRAKTFTTRRSACSARASRFGNVTAGGKTRLFYSHDGGTFGLSEPLNGEPATFGNGGTIGFKCHSPEQVKEFHDVAVAHGGTSIEDAPGLREGGLGPLHLAYVRDPDGNKLCAIYRGPLMETVSTAKSHGGTQGVYRHASAATGTDMTFSVFVPPHEEGARLPVLWYLSGLTCTHANVTDKGEYRVACAEHGVIFVAPDTSPRGDDVPDDDAWDFGQGAGFYVDATEEPWVANFRMRRYVEDELPALIAAEFPVNMARQGITGHSMGGHGALTIGLRNPDRFRSVSAFAPIVSPLACPWGEKALGGYLGEDRAAWRPYDACALIADGARVPEILVDQGDADGFLKEQLKPALLADASRGGGIDLMLRMQPGYDHSYHFIATFMADHVAWHAERLQR